MKADADFNEKRINHRLDNPFTSLRSRQRRSCQVHYRWLEGDRFLCYLWFMLRRPFPWLRPVSLNKANYYFYLDWLIDYNSVRSLHLYLIPNDLWDFIHRHICTYPYVTDCWEGDFFFDQYKCMTEALNSRMPLGCSRWLWMRLWNEVVVLPQTLSQQEDL